MSEEALTPWEKIRREFKNFLVIFAYLWVILILFALHKDFVLARSPLDGQLLAIINAAVLGKVIVLLEFFHVGKRVYHLPLAVRVAAKSVLFGLLLLLFYVVEEGVGGWIHGKGFAAALADIDGGKFLEFGTLAVLAIIVLSPYFLLREIADIIGVGKLARLLLSRPGDDPPAQGQ
jgi:hypothetical protein